MNSSNSCRFCDIVVGKYQHVGIDEPLANSDGFIAVASIGALIEGWTLIIPKEHQCSMRNVYRSSLFAGFTDTVISPLTKLYGPLVAFEHGANKKGSITACGTEHAHLHLVPLRKSLLPDIHSAGLKWVQCRASDIASISGTDEYLFYAELENKSWTDPLGHLHILERPISQFFRKLIAKHTENNELFDYRRFPQLDIARQTRKSLVELVA